MNNLRFLPLIGRILISLPFMMSGFGKITAYDQTIGYIGAAGLPLPILAYLVAIAIELGGGALLIAGYQTRLVAAVMAVFTLATAVAFHNNLADHNQMINFLKNIMITGGLLQIVYFGAGAFSLDARTSTGRPTGSASVSAA